MFTAIQLVFLLVALLLVINAFFPSWTFEHGPTFAIPKVIGLLIELVVLYVVYLIVLALFGVPAGLPR